MYVRAGEEPGATKVRPLGLNLATSTGSLNVRTSAPLFKSSSYAWSDGGVESDINSSGLRGAWLSRAALPAVSLKLPVV